MVIETSPRNDAVISRPNASSSFSSLGVVELRLQLVDCPLDLYPPNTQAGHREGHVMFETRKLEDRRTAMRRDQHRRIID